MIHPDGEAVVPRNDRLGRPANAVAQRYLDACPHWPLVPATERDNNLWRAKIRLAAINSPVVREKLWQMCAEDFVFWASSFVYLVEPRAGEDVQGRIPFRPWQHQIPFMCALHVEWGKRHLCGNKSRAQGASWIAAMKMVHSFVFGKDQHLGVGSKTESDADDPKRPGSMGWKIDFILSCLPGWMCPPGVHLGGVNRSVSSHTWVNETAGNYIKAEAATRGIGRGSRFTAFVLDEAAHFPNQACQEAIHNLLETSNGIIMISTPNGISGDGLEFYQRATNPGPWLTANLFWWDNPSQNRGLYSTDQKTGTTVIHDQEYPFPDNYKFTNDHKYRSPWYDKKERDHGFNHLLLAQELDGSFTGSVGRPFGVELIERCQQQVRKPSWSGQFMYEPSDLAGSGEVMSGGVPSFQCWRPLDARRRLPRAQYVLGCDVAAGTGGDWSSNSVISVFDCLTCEQVAEWASHKVPPTEFADLVVAMCWWLGQSPLELPFLIWERNGSTGTAFTARIISLGYPNVYRAGGGEELRPYVKKTDKPGYFNSRVDYALTPLLNAMTSGAVTIRSAECLREAGEYIYDGSKWVHPGSTGTLDASSQGLNHGDRVIAAGMAVHGLKDRGFLTGAADQRVIDPDLSPPPNSAAARMAAVDKARRQRDRERTCVW